LPTFSSCFAVGIVFGGLSERLCFSGIAESLDLMITNDLLIHLVEDGFSWAVWRSVEGVHTHNAQHKKCRTLEPGWRLNAHIWYVR
jgi:hypothetical protein